MILALARACALSGPLLAMLTVAASALDAARVLPVVVSVLPRWEGRPPNAEAPEGSGVAILDGRSIVTALHVVDRAREVFVRTYDGRILEAEIAGADPATDLALLTVESALPTLGRAAPVEPGERVCAVGNAFGLDLSITCGVVSRVHQSGVGFNPIEDFVQTDAAVNPGASGGALVDDEGHLVGILSAIFTKQSDANIGVNFAVSAILAERVVADLAAHGAVRWLVSGLRLEPFPPPGQTGESAARVLAVAPGSVAAAAGLAAGDLLVEADGRRVRKPADFTAALARRSMPVVISVTMERRGAARKVDLAFGRVDGK